MHRSLKNKYPRVFKVRSGMPGYRSSLKRCAGILKRGGLVAFPTETVYGIAANASDPAALRRLSAVKKRPRGKPFTVHIADKSEVVKMGCELTKEADALAGKFWPGPLTMVLRSKRGGKTGFRMPADRIALDLIKMAGVPIVAPSANLGGRPAPTDAAGVLKELSGKLDAVLDGGRTRVGIESTVIDMTVSPPKILREGAIKYRDIKALI